MRTSIRSLKLHRTILFVLLLLSLTACSTGESPTSPDESPMEAPETSSIDHSLPPVMGVALDPNGVAIPFAQVGDEIGDSSGVISGDLEISPTDWLAVDATGYATSYAHTFGESDGNSFFEARLTPFAAGTYLSVETSEKLIIQSDEQLSIELSIDSTFFTEPEPRVMMAVIDRLDVEASYEDVDARNSTLR